MGQKPIKHGNYEIKLVAWREFADAIVALRHKVFAIEQRLGNEFVEDDDDAFCQHIVAMDKQRKVVACGRLTSDGRIGRIAVAISHRQNGLGTRILSTLIECARRHGLQELSLNAETDVQPFYLHQNFHRDGPVFMKQGVPHQRLRYHLNT